MGSTVKVLDTVTLPNTTTHTHTGDIIISTHRTHPAPVQHEEWHRRARRRDVTAHYYFSSQISILHYKADSYITQRRLRFPLHCSNKKEKEKLQSRTEIKPKGWRACYLYQINS